MDERLNLTDPDVQVRASAAETLATMGEDASPSAVDLVRACADDESVSQWAVAALEGMGPPPGESIESLIAITSEGQPLSAYWAVTLLGRAGESASAAEMTLVKIVQTSDDDALKQRSVWALGKIHACSIESIDCLTAAAKSAEPRLAQMAKNSLEQIQT